MNEHLLARQALRLVAAVLLVVLTVLLGGVGTEDPPGPAYHHYVALGDSFTAAPYVPLPDPANGCSRSTNNYPQLLARDLGIEDLEDRSCTGAQTVDLYALRQETGEGRSVPPQFTALTPETDLVTVGIGANNDRLYARVATACRRSRTVCRLHDQRVLLSGIVGQVRRELAWTLREVRRDAPRARVLLVTYPRLLPERGHCPLLPRMRSVDRATFRGLWAGLHDAMAGAADDAGVELVDVYRASSGHDVCSSDPWVQGRTGDPHRAAGLHPLADGQVAVARMLRHTLRREPPPT